MMEWLRRFAHDVLGWHDGRLGPHDFDGASFVARCSRCQKRVLQDSQGNWFVASRQ